MRPLILAFALLLASTADAGAQAPSYLGAKYDRFEIASNKHLANARQLTEGMILNAVGQEAGKAEPTAPIWAAQCTHKKQTASFRRTVELYGAPAEATFDFTHEIGAKWKGKSPLRTYKLIVNGVVIVSGPVGKVQPNNLHTVFTAAQLAAFRDGANTIEISVVKAKSGKKKKRKCNTGVANRLGVTFRLFGRLAADLALLEPPTETFRRAGESNVQGITFNVRNDGPSSIPFGDFEITIIGADNVIVTGSGDPQPGSGFPPLAHPFSGCQVIRDTASGQSSWKVRCTLGRMPKGGSGLVSIGLDRQFSSSAFTEAYTYLSWRVSSTVPDPASQNNQRSSRIVWCGEQATNAGCSTAP